MGSFVPIGAGKTHTVSRLAPLLLDEIFTVLDEAAKADALVESGKKRVVSQKVVASFVEIYNESVSDLLVVVGDAPMPTPMKAKGSSWDDRKVAEDINPESRVSLRLDRWPPQ